MDVNGQHGPSYILKHNIVKLYYIVYIWCKSEIKYLVIYLSYYTEYWCGIGGFLQIFYHPLDNTVGEIWEFRGVPNVTPNNEVVSFV